MDPNQFYFLILPLAILVVILVIMVVYYARKENRISNIEMQMIHELMRPGEFDKVKFSTTLQSLFHKKLIDKKSYERMDNLLEEYFAEAEKS